MAVGLCVCLHQLRGEDSLMTVELGTNLSTAEYCSESFHRYYFFFASQVRQCKLSVIYEADPS